MVANARVSVASLRTLVILHTQHLMDLLVVVVVLVMLSTDEV